MWQKMYFSWIFLSNSIPRWPLGSLTSGGAAGAERQTMDFPFSPSLWFPPAENSWMINTWDNEKKRKKKKKITLILLLLLVGTCWNLVLFLAMFLRQMPMSKTQLYTRSPFSSIQKNDKFERKSFTTHNFPWLLHLLPRCLGDWRKKRYPGKITLNPKQRRVCDHRHHHHCRFFVVRWRRFLPSCPARPKISPNLDLKNKIYFFTKMGQCEVCLRTVKKF